MSSPARIVIIQGLIVVVACISSRRASHSHFSLTHRVLSDKAHLFIPSLLLLSSLHVFLGLSEEQFGEFLGNYNGSEPIQTSLLLLDCMFPFQLLVLTVDD